MSPFSAVHSSAPSLLRRIFRAVPLGLSALLLSFGTARAAPSTLEGLWVTSGFTSVVRITRDGGDLGGTLVWLWRDAIGGARTLDEHNPDESRRGRRLVGLSLFRQMRPENALWRGRIYNPEDGRTYRATLTPRSADVLRLRGCWGPFCRNQTWRRLESIELPTAADLD